LHLPSDILVPQVWVCVNKLRHELDAIAIVEYDKLHSALSEQVFCAHEIPVLAYDNSWNAVEQRRSGAHDARAQGTDERQCGPVAAPSGIANADDLSVRSGIAGLHAEIVSARDDATFSVNQDGADGQSTLPQSRLCFLQRLLQQTCVIHMPPAILHGARVLPGYRRSMEVRDF
jgi:hypothetical protein